MKARTLLAGLFAVLTLVFSAGCSKTAAPSPSAAAGAITVTDMTGAVVKLDKPAQRIVVLTASDCEMLYAVGAGATVIGRGEYCDYPAEVTKITSVKSGADTNIEQIIALKPDVVLMSKMAQTAEQVSKLQSAGIKVAESDAQSIDGIYTALTMIGRLTGKNDEAAKIIAGMKKSFDDIKAKVAGSGPKTGKSMYFEVSPLKYGLFAAGSGTFMDEIATMLGLKNTFGDMKGWAHVSEEQVLQRSPDYIVTTTMSMAGAPNPIDEILGRKGWGGVTAVKSRAIYNADTNSSALMHPGPRLADAALELYTFVYGK